MSDTRDEARRLAERLREDAKCHQEAWAYDKSGSRVTAALERQSAALLERIAALEPYKTVIDMTDESGVWEKKRVPLYSLEDKP